MVSLHGNRTVRYFCFLFVFYPRPYMLALDCSFSLYFLNGKICEIYSFSSFNSSLEIILLVYFWCCWFDGWVSYLFYLSILFKCIAKIFERCPPVFGVGSSPCCFLCCAEALQFHATTYILSLLYFLIYRGAFQKFFVLTYILKCFRLTISEFHILS